MASSRHSASEGTSAALRRVQCNPRHMSRTRANSAAVMARCMNSYGNPKNPLGGLRGGKCIMGARMKLQNKDKSAEV